MSVAEAIKEALTPFETYSERAGQLAVPTHCLYPSNSAVVVYVQGGEAEVMVSDGGGAVDELSTHNRLLDDPDRFLRRFCRPQGLRSRDGAIFSDLVAPHQLLSAVLLVANASATAARWGFEHIRHRRPRQLRQGLLEALERRYSKARIDLEHKLLGKSSRAYRFDQVVHLAGDRLLVIDSVIPDPNSINAHAIAHLDLSQLGDEAIVQRLVYDDGEEWPASDLNLLQMSATLVPFSRLEPALDRLEWHDEALERVHN